MEDSTTDEGYKPPPPSVPLQVYIDAAFAAHQKLHEAEAVHVRDALITHKELHAAEVKASEGMRMMTQWAVAHLPLLLGGLIGLVYFIVWLTRGGHSG